MGLDSYAFSVAPLLGRRVVITGLVAKPHLNWSTGTAMSFDDAKGRYSVKLETSSLMIKPSNLSPVIQTNNELAFSMISHDRLGQNADSWANKLPADVLKNICLCVCESTNNSMFSEALARGSGCFSPHERTEVAYWRKYHDFNNWMYQLYREKGGLKGIGNNYEDYLDFNCLPLRLTSGDLDALQNGGLAAVASGIPEDGGFLFGKDFVFVDKCHALEHGLDFVAKARTEIAKGREIYYAAWF